MAFSFSYVTITILTAIIIVFVLSIVLQYIVNLKNYILNFLGNNASVKNIEVMSNNNKYKRKDEIIDDLEVVAVIVAGISSYLDIPQADLRIKSIKRVNNNSE